ncbi:hypothetical protein FOA52_006437 [Chlamydomonas sp. UWO 241]|nr:hypothetical protein FOA52_006437 [Chlamydomonas sp. UWO 241]
MIIVLPLLHACTMAAIHIVVARYTASMQQRRALVHMAWAAPARAHSDAPADRAAQASEGGDTHLQGTGGATEQEQRALVEEVLLEEMLQEVDQAPEALPPHNGGHSRVHMQFATPLLVRTLGRDPELVVSFALARGAGTPAPLASLLRVRIGDLQVAARARGNPPGLMDVDIMMDMDVGLAGAAREYGGMLIAQLVDGPTMLAAVLVPLLPCAARPAVAELSWLGLDVRTASHIARDLGLLFLVPHPTGEPRHAHHALMRATALQMMQARSALEDGLGHAFLGNAASCCLYTLPFIVILVMRARPALLARLPRWLQQSDPSLLRRVYNMFVYSLVSTQVLGHIQPGICTLLRTGMDIPFMGLLDLVEPLEGHAWWARAALSVVLMLPSQVMFMCACSGQEGVETLCTRGAWGTFTSEVDLVAFVAPRVAAPIAATLAMWWLHARARSGGKSKQE